MTNSVQRLRGAHSYQRCVTAPDAVSTDDLRAHRH